MESISCHITLLVIASLGGGHTHFAENQFLETRHALAYGQWAPGLKVANAPPPPAEILSYTIYALEEEFYHHSPPPAILTHTKHKHTHTTNKLIF